MNEFVMWLLTDDTVRSVYIAILMGVMILPMIGLSIWFHSNIKSTGGGKKLMRQHTASHGLHRTNVSSMVSAARMFKGVRDGTYGTNVTQMYRVVWRVMGYWLLACMIIGGLPFALSAIFGPVS